MLKTSNVYHRHTFGGFKCLTRVYRVVSDSMIVLSVRTLVKSVSLFDTTHFLELDVLYTKKSHITKEIHGPMIKMSNNHVKWANRITERKLSHTSAPLIHPRKKHNAPFKFVVGSSQMTSARLIQSR